MGLSNDFHTLIVAERLNKKRYLVSKYSQYNDKGAR